MTTDMISRINQLAKKASVRLNAVSEYNELFPDSPDVQIRITPIRHRGQEDEYEGYEECSLDEASYLVLGEGTTDERWEDGWADEDEGIDNPNQDWIINLNLDAESQIEKALKWFKYLIREERKSKR